MKSLMNHTVLQMNWGGGRWSPSERVFF